jgi:hypothetical protein
MSHDSISQGAVHPEVPPGVLVLHPYLLIGHWVFDDARTGLKEEAFVGGMTEMITRVVASVGMRNPEKGFRLLFSDRPFVGHMVSIEKVPGGSKECGNNYRGNILGEEMTGWLCPALYLYFTEAPDALFMRVEPLPKGVKAIWTPGKGVPQRRFVSVPR